MKRALTWLLSLPIRFYRLVLSPVLPQSCRYHPTCSSYALEALQVHGPLKGLWLTAKRLGRCHPWGGHGLDPVPPAAEHSCNHHHHAHR
ncbi:MAG: membrane protein insertion efficiency factor YidD [Alphaproteobacteria bacterium]